MIYLTVPLTLLAPIFPWIALLSWDVGRKFEQTKLVVLAMSGVLLDLWWGKPLGATVVILSVLALVNYFGERLWPADNRVWLVVSLIGSALAMEAFIRL